MGAALGTVGALVVQQAWGDVPVTISADPVDEEAGELVWVDEEDDEELVVYCRESESRKRRAVRVSSDWSCDRW
jgi:hypothetical protein